MKMKVGGKMAIRVRAPQRHKTCQKLLEVIKDEVSAPHKKVKLKCAKIKPDVKFENPNDSYVKFCPGIEKNDKKMHEPIQDVVSAPHTGMKTL